MITPIILCGGAGTRLWPLSRKSYPKQFSQLIGDVTLFQASVLRFAGPGYAPPVVVTTDSFRFIVAEQLDKVGIAPGAILIEPEGRDTAAAVLAGAMHVALEDAEATILVAPSDHLIPEADLFARRRRGRAGVRRKRPARDLRHHAGPARDRLRLSRPWRPARPCGASDTPAAQRFRGEAGCRTRGRLVRRRMASVEFGHLHVPSGRDRRRFHRTRAGHAPGRGGGHRRRTPRPGVRPARS